MARRVVEDMAGVFLYRGSGQLRVLPSDGRGQPDGRVVVGPGLPDEAVAGVGYRYCRQVRAVALGMKIVAVLLEFPHEPLRVAVE